MAKSINGAVCSTGKPVRYCPPSGLLEFMRQVEKPGLINMAAGVPSPDLLPVRELKQAFRAATAGEGRDMWAYQQPAGHAGLREQIAKRLRSRGVAGKGENIILTTGCTQALHLAISALVKPGDLVACESPGYYNMLEQIYQAGAKALPLPVDINSGILLDGAEGVLRRYRPKCLVVCSSLSNPTGATLPPAGRRSLVRLCAELGIVVIEDDIYGELCEGVVPKPVRAYGNSEQVIYVTSFCKSVSPGLRVGCIVAGKWFETVSRLKCNSDLHSSVVSEATLCAFLKSGAFDRHLAVLRKNCRGRRKLVRDAVIRYFPEGTKVSDPQGGFLVWVELPFKLDSAAWAARTRAGNVSFARGEVFLTGAAARSCLRLNCARAAESDLENAVRILAEEI